MAKIKRYLIIPALLAAAVFALSGCMDFGGYGGAQSTLPPQKTYQSFDELKQAVAAAKADESAADEENLKSLTSYYDLKAVPEGAKLSYIKVSASVIRVGYAFGETNADTFDNQMEIAWYRTASGADYLSQIVKNLAEYETISIGGANYVHTTPDIQFAVTPAPGDTAAAEATPTPRTGKYCQFVYWVQGDAAFMSAVPLSFTKEDIGKYCQGVKVDLG